MYHMQIPRPAYSAGFILWGSIIALVGVIFNVIAYILAIDSIGSYRSSAADTAGVMFVFGGIFLLLGAILLIVGTYRAFRLFDAVGQSILFGPQRQHVWDQTQHPLPNANSGPQVQDDQWMAEPVSADQAGSESRFGPGSAPSAPGH